MKFIDNVQFVTQIFQEIQLKIAYWCYKFETGDAVKELLTTNTYHQLKS